MQVMMMMMNCFTEWLTNEMREALFLAGIIATDSHHSKSQTLHELDLNVCKTLVQDLLNEVITTALWRQNLFQEHSHAGIYEIKTWNNHLQREYCCFTTQYSNRSRYSAKCPIRYQCFSISNARFR